MSRHNRNVPTSFYRRFALDATSFAHRHAAGKCLAVLEGGYSDRALASASAAFLCGFADRAPPSANNEDDNDPTNKFTANQERDGWWSELHLKRLEKACSLAKTRRGAHSSSAVANLLVGTDGGAAAATRDPWLARAVEIFAHLEDTAVASSISSSSLAPSSGSTLHSDPNTPRQLRDRTKSRPINYAALADGSSPLPSPVRGAWSTSTSTRPPSASNRLRGEAASSSDAATASPSFLPQPVPVLPPAFASAAGADEASSSATSDGPPHPAQPVFAFTSPDLNPPTRDAAPSSVPAAAAEAMFDGAGGERAHPSAETAAPVKPAIRFTWKQGGFGGEPRM